MSADHGDNPNMEDMEFEEVKEQDRFLPIANVARIMKRALPENAKIAKDAKETVQECVSEFISFITSEASDRCQQEKRKTINGEDILWSMSSLGFDDYAEALRIYLIQYRESAKMERAVAASASGAGAADLSHGAEEMGSGHVDTSLYGNASSLGYPGDPSQ